MVAVALLVVAFVALYPYLAGMDACEVGECPYAALSSHEGAAGSVAVACVVAVLTSFAAVVAFAAERGHRFVTANMRIAQLYIPPDPPPPRFSPAL